MDCLIGTIILMAINFVPIGFLPCNGQTVNIAEYEALYALLGTTYGGDGRSTFGIPDFRGRVPVGAPTNKNQKGGAAAVTLTGLTLPAHTHSAPALTAASDLGTSSVPAVGGRLSAGKSDAPRQPELYRADAPSGTAVLNGASTANSAAAGSVSPAAVENMQSYVGLNYYICAEGSIPQQN